MFSLPKQNSHIEGDSAQNVSNFVNCPYTGMYAYVCNFSNNETKSYEYVGISEELLKYR
jgi:hypothetical protein